MKKFKIYGFSNDKPVVITNTLEALSPASSFDETLVIQENKKASLTFNIYKKVSVSLNENFENPFLPILYERAKIRYEDMETNDIIDFVITNINYTISKENVKYTIKAEDYASQVFSKRGQNMTIDKTGNIEEITDEILLLSGMETNTDKDDLKSWKISLKLSDFTSPIDRTKIKKATLILSNTNMYNALIETALLFNANIDFDYKRREIKFANKSIEKFNGFRLRPDVNLSAISVSNNVTNFTTAMHITGGEMENIDTGIKYTLYPIPDMPKEVMYFFSDCVDNNFGITYDANGNIISTNEKYFSTYDSEHTYISKLSAIEQHISSQDNAAERKEIIKEYLQLCDLFPHLENTLYDIYYFYSIGAISEKKLNKFYNVLNNEIRRRNIEITLHSNRYYNSYIEYANSENEIQNYIEFLTAEELYKQKLLDSGKTASDEEVIRSEHNINSYTRMITDIVTSQKFISAVLNIYGNDGKASGFDKILDSYTNSETGSIAKYKKQYDDAVARIADIDKLLKDLN